MATVEYAEARGCSVPAAARGALRAGALVWPHAIAALVLVVWLIPIKAYRLPVRLPFNLELYRLAVLILLLGLAASIAVRGVRPRVGRHGKPLALLIAAALASLIVNSQRISDAGLQTQALKSLSFLVSFVLVYFLVTSTVTGLEDARAPVVALVVGSLVVAVAAIYEARTHHNVFAHLSRVMPFLHYEGFGESARAGRLRVRASAQHPIALGVALLTCLPLALYLARYAASVVRKRLWYAAAIVIATAAFATLSRTAVITLAAMLVAALLVRASAVKRSWPLLLLLPFVIHFAAPGSIKTLYKAFSPKGGLLAEQQRRAGQQGSGRLADIGPGLHLWARQPILGGGYGTTLTRADDPKAIRLQQLRRARSGTSDEVGTKLYFDDQYLSTLVQLGAVGVLALVWLVWGAVLKLARTARRRAGPAGDLAAACAVSCAGFGVSMVTFDAFSFVQATLVFFIIASLGLAVRRAILSED